MSITEIDFTRPAPTGFPITLSWGTTDPFDVAITLKHFVYEVTGGANSGPLASAAREACNAIVRGEDLDGFYLEGLWDCADEAAGDFWGVGTHPDDPAHILIAPAEWWETVFDMPTPDEGVLK